jgi:hypothetical protein
MAEASSGEALEGLAEALYLEREYAEAAAHYERAYAAYRWERRSMAAGRAARAVAWITGNVLGDWAVQSGWIARAGTILEEAGTDGPERGWVLILRSYAPGRRPRCCWPAGATRSWSWTGRRSQRHRLDPSAAPAGRGLAAPLGLLERLTATGCPPIGTYAFDFGPFTISGVPGTDDTPVAYGPRRTVLDKLLVDAAADAGAEVREGFTVQEVVVSDGRVTGIRGHGRDGGTVTEQAWVVVGADGRHSAVARAVAPEQYHERPPLLCGYYSYWSGLPMGGRFETWVRPERGFAAWPTHDDLTLVIGGWPYAELEANRDDIEGNSWPCWRWRRPSPSGSGRPNGRSALSAPRWPATSVGRTGRVGPWSGMPATTGTSSPPRGCTTPSGTPSCAPPPWTRPSPGSTATRGRWTPSPG